MCWWLQKHTAQQPPCTATATSLHCHSNLAVLPQAYKYTPFGPLATVMPYLIRRAQENSTLLGGSQAELQLVQVGHVCVQAAVQAAVRVCVLRLLMCTQRCAARDECMPITERGAATGDGGPAGPLTAS